MTGSCKMGIPSSVIAGMCKVGLFKYLLVTPASKYEKTAIPGTATQAHHFEHNLSPF